MRQISVGEIKLSESAKKYLNRVIDSNRLTYGSFTKKLEAVFAKLHQRRWAVFTSSGTGALQASIAALKEFHHWRDGDEVLVPAISFVSTANSVYYLGLKPIFVDVEPDTYNLDPKKIIDHLTSRTRAILPVHVLGLPADMPKITAFAKKYQLKIIEDSCDAMFVGIGKKRVGSFGDLAAFSTYVAHLLPTGIGGFVVGDSLRLEKIVRSFIFHGRSSAYLSIDNQQKKAIKKRFQFDRIGSHFRLTELEAAIGLSQLQNNQYQKNIRRRQMLAKKLIKVLQPLSGYLQLPTVPAGFEHAFMMFPLLIKNPSADKWKLIYFLEKNGIATRELLPLLNQPSYKKTFGDLENQYPVAKLIRERGFYFGCHPYMNEKDINYIAAKLHEFFSK